MAFARRHRKRTSPPPSEPAPDATGPPPSSGPAPPGVPLTDLLPLLFPDVADQAGLRTAATAHLGTDRISSTLQLRQLLASLDVQAYPTPVTVRWRPGDARLLELDGVKLWVDPSDLAVSTHLINHGTYEAHVVAAMRTLVSPGMHVADVGANVGYHSILLSRLVGSQGQVTAVEANSENLRMIIASLAANGIDNVKLVPLAFDEQWGWSFFTAHVGTNGGMIREEAVNFVEGAGWIVPTAPLDDVLTRPVHFIKIDVEGAEGRVLAGASDTLRLDRPVVITEFSVDMLQRVSGMQPLDYLRRFEQLDYEIHILDRTQPGHFGPSLTPTALLSQWHDQYRIEDLLFLPRSAASA